MIKNNRIKIIIGILCVVILILVAVVAVFLDSRSPEPILGIFQTEPTVVTEETGDISYTEDPTEGTQGGSSTEDPTEGTEGNPPDDQEPVPDDQVPVPDDKPSSVIIPTEKNPQTGEPEGLVFPCQVPEYGLVIEKLEPYNGMFVENGSNVNVENVAMMMVKNNGDFPVEYTQICVEYGLEKLLFDISALPVGEKLVVQEKTGKPIPEGKVSYASATVVQRAEMEMSESQVRVTENGNNTLSIRNLTNKSIPTVRVFYKYYMKEEGVFVGGIAFTVRLTRLGAGATVTVQPAHYNSQTCRVVMVLTYDTEV